MAECERRIVMAGDIIAELSGNDENEVMVTLGPGLRRDQDENVVATKCGFLQRKGQSTFWVDSYQKHYVASRGECVLGIVTAKTGDIFRVNIGATDQASLSYLSFEGATKRNRPNIQIGDVVYAKVLVAIKDMEPELVCVDRHGKAAGLGVPSEGGFLFQVSLNLVRKLLSPSCCLMKALGQHFKFETAIGMNGRVWVKGMSVKETIVLTNAMSLAENMTEDEIKVMVSRLVGAMAGFQ